MAKPKEAFTRDEINDAVWTVFIEKVNDIKSIKTPEHQSEVFGEFVKRLNEELDEV